MRLAFALLLVPAFAFAAPKFSTTITVDVADEAMKRAFVDALRLKEGTKLDGCWRKATRLKLTVTVARGKVIRIDLAEVDVKAPLPCLTKALRTMKIGVDAEEPQVFTVELTGQTVLATILNSNTTANLAKFNNITFGNGSSAGFGTGTGVGTSAGTGVGTGAGAGVGTSAGASMGTNMGRGGGGASPVQSKVVIGPPETPSIDIDRVVQARLGVFRACHQRERNRTPGLTGTLTVKFQIAADGSVVAARVDTTTLNSSALEDCVVRNVLRMRFVATGAIIDVSYPFSFAG